MTQCEVNINFSSLNYDDDNDDDKRNCNNNNNVNSINKTLLIFMR